MCLSKGNFSDIYKQVDKFHYVHYNMRSAGISIILSTAAGTKSKRSCQGGLGSTMMNGGDNDMKSAGASVAPCRMPGLKVT